MRHILTSLLFLTYLACSVTAQIGINTTSPDTTALLDIYFSGTGGATGVLLPNVNATTRDGKKGKVSNGMLVFDSNENLLYYYDSGLKEWIAVNPLGIIHSENGMQDIRPQNTKINSDLNMSLGLPVGAAAQAKLDVNGNVKVRKNMTVDGSDTIAGNSIVRQDLMVSGTTNMGGALTIDSTLTVNNNINAGSNTINAKNINATTLNGYGTTPLGGIIMWTGTTAPDGWKLCDGTTINDPASTYNGTSAPNLKGRFIVGYDSGDGDYNNIGRQAGERTHTLQTHELPDFSISVPGQTDGDNSDNNNIDAFAGGDKLPGANPFNISVQYSRNRMAGTYGQPHENRPPYYVLAFIMRIK